MSGLRSGGGAARDQQGGHGRRKKPSEDGSTSTGSGVNLADIQYCARRGHSLDRVASEKFTTWRCNSFQRM